MNLRHRLNKLHKRLARENASGRIVTSTQTVEAPKDYVTERPASVVLYKIRPTVNTGCSDVRDFRKLALEAREENRDGPSLASKFRKLLRRVEKSGKVFRCIFAWESHHLISRINDIRSHKGHLEVFVTSPSRKDWMLLSSVSEIDLQNL